MEDRGHAVDDRRVAADDREIAARATCFRVRNVLEQDRVVLEVMEPDANEREMLYQHDMGIVRLRRHMKNLAKAQLAAGEVKAA